VAGPGHWPDAGVRPASFKSPGVIPLPDVEDAIADLSEAVRLSFKPGGFVLLTPERFEYVREEWGKCRIGLPWGATGRTRPWESRDMVNNFLKYTLRALRRADLKLTAPFKLHTFRKSFAQNLADAGTPPKTLATLLGHSDVQVTMQYYARMTDANVREAARAADQLFASPPADRKAKGVG
jgi:integrase